MTDTGNRAALLPVSLVAAVFLATAAGAATIPVDATGQNGYSSIFLGIHWASDGDTVLVHPGVYGGAGNCDLTVTGEDLTLVSLGGHEVTIIDLQGQPGILLEGWHTDAMAIDGFTFTSAGDAASPYAVYAEDGAAFRIRDCVFRDRALIEATGYGERTISGCEFTDNSYAIRLDEPSKVTVRGCEFDGNQYGAYLGSLHAGLHSVTFACCSFVGNGRCMLLRSNSYVLVDSCSFAQSTSGPWSWNTGTSVELTTHFPAIVTVSNCSFIGNHSTESAGAMEITCYGGRIDIEDCLFENNMARHSGGAVFCEGESVTFSRCTFRRNTASAGGAVFADESGTTGIVKATDCVFEENEAADGGAVASTHWRLAASGCEFMRNTAERGGAVFGREGLTDVDGCLFTGNHAHMWGGSACFMDASRTPGNTFDRCTFDANRSHRGGVALADHSLVKLTECTLFGNRADDASVVATRDAQSVLERTVASFAGVGAAVSVQLGSAAWVTACAVFGNAGGDSLAGAGIHPSDNLFVDPLFCDVAAGDYTLCVNSPCAPANNPLDVLIGAHYTGCGYCDNPVEPTTWGAIKAMYR